MKRAFVFFAAAVISTAAIADDGSPAIGTGLRSPFLGGTGGRIESSDDDPSRGSGYVGGGLRSGLLTGSNSAFIGSGSRTVGVHLVE